MPSKRYQQPTEYKVEFWTDIDKPRKRRHRYYSTPEGMLRAGARWEAKGRDYWCRYWHGLSTWLSATRTKLDPSHPALLPETLGRASELAYKIPERGISKDQVTDLVQERIRRRGRAPSQVFSVFGACEAAAADIMLKDGRAIRKIPVDEIPDSALYNQFGNKALFAVLIAGEQIPAFEQLCKELRA